MMTEIEAQLRKDNSKLRADSVAMEVAVTERLGYLQRYKVIMHTPYLSGTEGLLSKGALTG